MNKTFAILGAGMQGTAAAYDLAKHAPESRIILGDSSLTQAQKAAERVDLLVGRKCCEAAQVDAMDEASLKAFLADVDVVVSCVPYWMHPRIAAAAIEGGAGMVDLGGNTEITLETLALDERAKAAGVSVIPDCGLAPGLVNNIGAWLLDNLDVAESIKLYCGVLPQNPQPPLNYKLTFNVEGLVTEYDFEAVTVRDGEITLVDTLAELEELHVEELGCMEAFTTSGGTSTAPYSFKDRVPNYEYKTIRFPGHCEKVRMFRELGFWSTEEVQVGSATVKPREVFYKVFGDALSTFEDLDQCAVRGVGEGSRNGEHVKLQVDIFDRQCAATGFTSMERLTGFSIAIYALEVAKGATAPGALRYETAVNAEHFLTELQKRGIAMKFSEERVLSATSKVHA